MATTSSSVPVAELERRRHAAVARAAYDDEADVLEAMASTPSTSIVDLAAKLDALTDFDETRDLAQRQPDLLVPRLLLSVLADAQALAQA